MNRKRDIILNVGMVVFTIILLIFALMTLGVLTGCDATNNSNLTISHPDSRIKLPTRMDVVVSDYSAEQSPIYQAAKQAEEEARIKAERIAAEELAAEQANQTAAYTAYQSSGGAAVYGSWREFLEAVAARESHGDYYAESALYRGRYQISDSWYTGAYGAGFYDHQKATLSPDEFAAWVDESAAYYAEVHHGSQDAAMRSGMGW